MSINKTSQVIEIMEEPSEEELYSSNPEDMVVIYDEKPDENVVLELHDPDTNIESSEVSLNDSPSEFSYDDHEELSSEFTFSGIPGVEQDQFVEVVDEDLELKDSDFEDDKRKPKGPWDWKTGGLEGFLLWLKDRFKKVPTHDGKSTVGVERAMNYLNELDKCISEAMRIDLDGVLDASKIEEIRSEIDDGVSRLEERLSKLEDNFKTKKKKNKSASSNASFTKEAGTPHVSGIMVTVPLLISSIARTCINGTISAGHDIEDLYHKQVGRFDLDDREQAEVIQLLADMGYTLRRDRLQALEEKYDETSSDNGDFAANYQS